MLADPLWDPNTWEILPKYRTITISTDGEIFCKVDAEHYEVLMEVGPWHLYDYRGKKYAKRTRRRGEYGYGACIYMHRWIAEQFLKPPATVWHILVDHKNSNGLDNRSKNLIWSTPQQNRLNLYGMWWRQKDFLKELQADETAQRKSLCRWGDAGTDEAILRRHTGPGVHHQSYADAKVGGGRLRVLRQGSDSDSGEQAHFL